MQNLKINKQRRSHFSGEVTTHRFAGGYDAICQSTCVSAKAIRLTCSLTSVSLKSATRPHENVGIKKSVFYIDYIVNKKCIVYTGFFEGASVADS